MQVLAAPRVLQSTKVAGKDDKKMHSEALSLNIKIPLILARNVSLVLDLFILGGQDSDSESSGPAFDSEDEVRNLQVSPH